MRTGVGFSAIDTFETGFKMDTAISRFSSLPVRLRLDKGGFPLGLFQDAAYEQQTFSVWPGDVLISYTDGVVEIRSPSGEGFGVDRLSSIVASRKNLSSRGLQDAILDEIRRFRGDTEPLDDLTLLVVKVL